MFTARAEIGQCDKQAGDQAPFTRVHSVVTLIPEKTRWQGRLVINEAQGTLQFPASHLRTLSLSPARVSGSCMSDLALALLAGRSPLTPDHRHHAPAPALFFPAECQT